MPQSPSPFTDAIVYLDDASSDETPQIVESLVQECRIERIIRKKNGTETNLATAISCSKQDVKLAGIILSLLMQTKLSHQIS